MRKIRNHVALHSPRKLFSFLAPALYSQYDFRKLEAEILKTEIYTIVE